MNSDTLIFCTCAQGYQSRVNSWYDRLKVLPADFLAVSDGTVGSQSSTGINPGVSVVACTPKLGRVTQKNFPGWRRSFQQALKYAKDKYQYIIHIENDVLVNNIPRLLQFWHKPGFYSGIDQKWNFLQAAFQILNDKNKTDAIIQMYDNKDMLYQQKLTQFQLAPLGYTYVLSCHRMQTQGIDYSSFDIVPQMYGKQKLH